VSRVDPASRDQRRAAYLDTTAETDSHTASCAACRTGRVCGTADQLMDDEYRRVEELRAVDPYAARAADRADWPTEG
jgi:hypothetical protein